MDSGVGGRHQQRRDADFHEAGDEGGGAEDDGMCIAGGNRRRPRRDDDDSVDAGDAGGTEHSGVSQAPALLFLDACSLCVSCPSFFSFFFCLCISFLFVRLGVVILLSELLVTQFFLLVPLCPWQILFGLVPC